MILSFFLSWLLWFVTLIDPQLSWDLNSFFGTNFIEDVIARNWVYVDPSTLFDMSNAFIFNSEQIETDGNIILQPDLYNTTVTPVIPELDIIGNTRVFNEANITNAMETLETIIANNPEALKFIQKINANNKQALELVETIVNDNPQILETSQAIVDDSSDSFQFTLTTDIPSDDEFTYNLGEWNSEDEANFDRFLDLDVPFGQWDSNIDHEREQIKNFLNFYDSDSE